MSLDHHLLHNCRFTKHPLIDIPVVGSLDVFYRYFDESNFIDLLAGVNLSIDRERKLLVDSSAYDVDLHSTPFLGILKTCCFQILFRIELLTKSKSMLPKDF